MEEVRQLVQEEGREARNLVAFHVAVDTPDGAKRAGGSPDARISRKPPRGIGGPVAIRRAPPRPARRSASAGRDKRSELRARYWALLFGDLQRAIGEIYNTVEAHENLNECQEVILVLENYTRDFKALGEWFRLKWEYDNTPPPQRPQSLAWEIRKTDFVRPESRRTYSVRSSPSVSGKNSPCLSGHNTPSGKNSPNLTGKASPGSGKISPRISSGHSSTSPKANIEFFSSKIAASKVTAKPEPKLAKETSRLSDITEKDVKDNIDENPPSQKEDLKKETKITPTVEIGKAKECPNVSPRQVVIKSPKRAVSQDNSKSTSNELRKSSIDTNSTRAKDVTSKLDTVNIESRNSATESNSTRASEITKKLDAMENEFLAKQLSENKIKNENMLNHDKDDEKAKENNNSDNFETAKPEKNFSDEQPMTVVVDDHENTTESESPTKSEDNFADISNESSSKSADGKLLGILDISVNVEEKSEDDKKISEISLTKDISVAMEVKQQEIVIKSELNESKLKPEKKHKSTEGKTKPADKKTKATEERSKTPIEKPKIGDDNPKISDLSKGKSEVSEQKTNFLELPSKSIIEIQKDVKVTNVKTSEKDKYEDESLKKSETTDLNKPPRVVEQNGLIDNKDDLKKEAEKKDPKAMEAKTTRPAYSQAAAKPKPVSAIKTEVKTPTKTTGLIRSKTVVEIRPSSAPKPQRQQFPKKNQASKCSYPFNLTTGRTSLFDSPANANKNVVAKKPLNKNVQLGAGDAKSSQSRVDTKKPPPRPTSLKINDQGSKKESKNIALEKIKDCDEYSSSETIVTQIDMSRIESSESLKTLVQEDLQIIDDVANSIEVLNVDNNKNDNEGWLTVKSRRLSRESKKQSKSHWAQRFHQPSATTSLPTLNMIESPKQETKPIVNSPKNAKLDRAKSEQPEKVVKTPDIPSQVVPEIVKPEISKPEVAKPEKIVKVSENVKLESKAKDPSMIRQKSDVTGLKTKSSKSKALIKKAERSKDDECKDEEMSELTKNRLHSSLESLTTGLARSQESTEEAFDFDKWKVEFKSTFKYFDDDDQILNDTDILEAADPSERSEIAEMTSQIEENEKKLGWALDFQSEMDQRKLCEEEDLLNRQIMELQQVSDIDLDTETDDTETDAEILCEEVIGRAELVTTLGTLSASLEDRYETALAGMSWAERVDTLGALEALVARDPGRAQQLHAKLSQGIKRRGSLQDALRRLQAKQARAERQRMEYQTERAKKIHQLLAKVEEVKVAKNQLIEEKRLRMEKRLQKAAENRDQHLKDIVRKAHDEEEKLREIAFIKQLEAENRRHDFLDQCRSHTTRLRQMRRERLDKLEQKAAREAAVGARRLALEAARRRRVEALLERRRLRDARRDTLDQLRRRERRQAAKEKADGVKSRLNALAVAAELEADALRSRIRDKQDASQQRLESHLQAIREKATTGPRQATTSESQEPGTKEERELAEQAARQERERRERDKQKAVKKRARKVKMKLLSAGNNGEDPTEDFPLPFEPYMSASASKLLKVINSLNNIINPLLDDRDININGHDDKKKKKNSKQLVNGDIEEIEHKKKSKKKNSKEKSDDAIETNNNTEELQNEAESSSNTKKKKKKDKSDRPKLSKTSSVCSSLSDMSRGSCKSERARVVLDLPLLERQLNELNRLVERLDMIPHSPTDRVVFEKVHGLKLLSRLLALAAEREDFSSQLTTRVLTTVVSVAGKLCGACRISAAWAISASASVYLVQLLADQLEKDMSDPRELELSKQLSDCLSVILDAVLCSTRLYEEGKQFARDESAQAKGNSENLGPSKEEAAILGMLRMRAHTLISYICLSGCITRAEKAGEAREGIQTLLTVCADLCQLSDTDEGTDRLSATQSLRCALGTSVCGSRAEFCSLFARGAQLGEKEGSGGFVRAARTAHLLRALAELDYRIVQEAFGEAGWPLEFRAAVARLLSQHAPSDKEAPRTCMQGLGNQRLDKTLSETMVLDLIVLVGFVVVNNPQLQETILEGWTVIKTLCTLPANWLVSKRHSSALLPTLAALADRPSAAAAIAAELSIEMIEEFMESPEAQKIKLVQVIKQSRGKRPAKK